MTSSNSLNKSKEDWETFILKTFRIPIPNVIIGVDSKQNRDRGLFIEDFRYPKSKRILKLKNLTKYYLKHY